jgi:hypothetical protein
MAFQKCSGGNPNGGHPTCKSVLKEGKRFLRAPINDANGAPIVIPEGTTVDSTFIQGKLFADADKWTLLEVVENVDTAREADILQTFTSGATASVDQGVRNYASFMPYVEPVYGEKVLEPIKRQDSQLFIIATDGSLRGIAVDADHTAIRGVYVEPGTFQYQWAEPSKGTPTVQGYNITFQYGVTELDYRMVEIPSTSIDGINLVSYPGVLGVALELTGGVAATVSGVSVDASFAGFGPFADATPFEAGEASDFSVINVTNAGAVVPFTLTQDPAGTYVIVFDSAQTLADELAISLVAPSTTNKPFKGLNTITTIVA